MNAYATWLSDLVERYDGDGVNDMPGLTLPITHYEILNEPEMNSPELTFFIGTAKEYAVILNVSYTAVKTACADCYVLHGGAAGSPDTLGYWNDVFSYGPSFDISNIHYIGMWDRQSLNTKDWNELLQQNGINAPIWVTEAEISGQEYSAIKNNLVNTQRTFWYGMTKVMASHANCLEFRLAQSICTTLRGYHSSMMDLQHKIPGYFVAFLNAVSSLSINTFIINSFLIKYDSPILGYNASAQLLLLPFTLVLYGAPSPSTCHC